MKIGFSNKELFACIDDDIDIPGTSLQSRKLYPIDKLRKGEHHATAPFGIQKNLGFLKNLFLSNQRNESIYASLKSQKSKLIWSKIANALYNIFRDIDTVIYSTHNLLNYLFNYPEIHYKLKVKSSLSKEKNN
jgi:hypothetical protein